MARAPKPPRAEQQPTADRSDAPARITKRARLAAMLAAPEGARLDELAAALCWKPHTVRAALSALRKSGATLERSAPDGTGTGSRYRLLPRAEGEA